jgi:hypothetical protein
MSARLPATRPQYVDIRYLFGQFARAFGTEQTPLRLVPTDGRWGAFDDAGTAPEWQFSPVPR